MGQSLVIIQASRAHSDTPHSVGLLRTSDQPVAETSVLDKTQDSQETDIRAPPVGFEPTIPASERPQTHALYGAATGIGPIGTHCYKIGSQALKSFTD